MAQYCVLASEGRQRYSVNTKKPKNIEEKKNPLTLSDDPLYEGANLDQDQVAHFFSPAQLLTWSQTSPFSPPIHTCEHLTDNLDNNMLDSSSVGHG
jgi:hypothetical protein